MIKVVRQAAANFKCIGTALLIAVISATASAAESEIPIGPADENAETSRAVTAILNRCVVAYEELDTLHTTGQYLSVSKDEDSETTYSEARVTLDYESPNRLAAHVFSDSPELACAFVADGTTVSQVWVNAYFDEQNKKFLQLPQTEMLGAFVDTRREGGELFDDKSGTLAVTAIANLLISNDVHEILFANIDRFIYEGSVEVGSHQCHQVRFIQSSPDVNVILWIDAASSLIRKTSFIYSYDENYDLVDSFEEGNSAEMMVMTWDEITTDPAKIDGSAFEVEVPSDHEKFDPKANSSSYKPHKSFWESLVSGAAETAEVTTWTLTREQGSMNVSSEAFLELHGELLVMDDYQFPDSTSRSLLIAAPDGKVQLYDNSGKLKSSVDLKQKITNFDCMETTTGEAMQFLAIPDDAKTMIAWDLDGKPLWSYSHPLGNVSHLASGFSESSVYIGLHNGVGVRKLDEAGNIEYANGSGWAYWIYPAPPALDRVMCVSIAKLNFFDSSLNLKSTYETYPEMDGITIQWDTENPAAPIIALVDTPDDDVLLQRRTLSGDVLWTTMVKPELDNLLDYDVGWLTIPVDGKSQRCISCVLSTGDIMIADENGKALYRAHLDVDVASVNRAGGENISYSCIADLDGNGSDEIYVQADKTLLRLDFQ